MIDNKYYSAKVLFCTGDSRATDIAVHGVEVIILHHDAKEKNTKSLDDCLPLVHSLLDADIFLLACESFDGQNSREKGIVLFPYGTV